MIANKAWMIEIPGSRSEAYRLWVLELPDGDVSTVRWPSGPRRVTQATSLPA